MIDEKRDSRIPPDFYPDEMEWPNGLIFNQVDLFHDGKDKTEKEQEELKDSFYKKGDIVFACSCGWTGWARKGEDHTVFQREPCFCCGKPIGPENQRFIEDVSHCRCYVKLSEGAL